MIGFRGTKKLIKKDTGVTILTSGCRFKGTLYCKGATRIAGQLEGEIISEGTLIVEETATVTAKVRAQEIIIQGTLKGKLDVSERAELTSTSCVDAVITTASLMIHEGARFNGSFAMTTLDQETKETEVNFSQPSLAAVHNTNYVK